MRRFWLAMLCVLLFGVPAFAGSGSAVCTWLTNTERWVEIEWVCTSSADATGTVSDPTITGIPAATKYTGTIRRVIVIPDSGDTAPDDNYDVKLHPIVAGTIVTGIDLLGDWGNDPGFDNATTYIETPITSTNGAPFFVCNEGLSPYGVNIGNANKYTIRVLLEKVK